MFRFAALSLTLVAASGVTPHLRERESIEEWFDAEEWEAALLKGENDKDNVYQ